MGVLAALEQTTWQQAERQHQQAVDEALAGHLARRDRGQAHPVEDFLFTYYRLRPGGLRRWHPGVGVRLAGAAARKRLRWRWYTQHDDDTVVVDINALATDRGPTLRQAHRLLTGTAGRAPAFSCYGLHEWAMVYRADGHRHPLPLRLGQDGTDAVVDSHVLRCTHLDAYRFFTPPAAPRNTVRPTRASAPDLEQPGCLHATMDLYRFGYTLGPGCPSDLLLACFLLARDVRTLDMQASPYDLSALGLAPVAIETPAGKAEYARRQRALAGRAAPLRHRLIGVYESVVAARSDQPDLSDTRRS